MRALSTNEEKKIPLFYYARTVHIVWVDSNRGGCALNCNQTDDESNGERESESTKHVARAKHAYRFVNVNIDLSKADICIVYFLYAKQTPRHSTHKRTHEKHVSTRQGKKTASTNYHEIVDRDVPFCSNGCCLVRHGCALFQTLRCPVESIRLMAPY